MIEQKINQLQNALTEAYKNRVKQLGLVKSGKMLNSINAVVKVENNNLKISVIAEDYFYYVDEQNKITDWVLSQNNINSLIADITTDIILKGIF